MSFQAVAAALNHSRATPSAKLVLTIIGYFEGENGAWPSQKVISEMAGISIRQVRRAIKELADLNELDIISHAGTGRSFARQTNRYFVIVECPDGCDSSLGHKPLGDTNVPTRGHPRSHYGTPMTEGEDTHVRLTIKNNNEQTQNLKRTTKLVAVN